ncbi:hypothetical protein RCIP0012_00027 [Klebsiella phage RCIP0012]|uniref:Uncharacterized protein n=1 Tax=Klebsiella phage May TaxID=2054272 RepID=A0A2H5BNT7_9CAUD|nr:hypothetical protein HOS53_gp160 [Klebsiella phage May]AUG88000.1 hypothetical protein CPT_May_086 [Klebsiella phage May]
MKQLVAIYAVGVTTTDLLNNKIGRSSTTTSLLKILVDETGTDNAKEIPFSFLSGSVKPGLYVAIVNMSTVGELKVFPLVSKNQAIINETIKPELLQRCCDSIDAFLGLVDTEEGEPTPAYVDQDPK